MTVNIAWDKIIGKKVKSIDDKDIGKIKQVFEDHIQIKTGLIGKDHSIPKSYVERYEDDKVFLSLTKGEIKEKFKK